MSLDKRINLRIIAGEKSAKTARNVQRVKDAALVMRLQPTTWGGHDPIFLADLLDAVAGDMDRGVTGPLTESAALELAEYLEEM